MIEIRAAKDEISFAVRVVPRASRSEIAGEHDGALRVRVTAAPVEGAANTELIKLLAKAFGVAASHVNITGGQRSKQKRVSVAVITPAHAAEVLRRLSGDGMSVESRFVRRKNRVLYSPPNHSALTKIKQNDERGTRNIDEVNC